MANLSKKGDFFVARFRHLGKEYKKSLHTKERGDAEAAMHEIEGVLHCLNRSWLTIPPGVDPGDFIVSGGTLEAPVKVERRNVPTLKTAMDQFLANLGHLASSNRGTIGVHLRNLQKHLGDRVNVGVDEIRYGDLESFIQARLNERSSTTVRKERQTVVDFFRWVVASGHAPESPAASLPEVKAEGNLPPFRTIEEIEAMIERGGLDHAAKLALWDCIYLSPEEIADLLEMVRQQAKATVSFLAHAIPAYTGMRRGELLRLKWSDIEFEHDSLTARSKKQSRQVSESRRRIDLHPELKIILTEWKEKRPKGQYILCDEGTLDPLTPQLANSRFWQPLRRTRWCLESRKNSFKIGFHTYRHSFASNLAAAGVDQRIIDGWMGHQTEAMRERYRHLFPRDRQTAMRKFSLRPAE